jgi:hypothetical protein
VTQEWVVQAPENVVWTPGEMEQIGRAIQVFQKELPGSQPFVTLDGLQVLVEIRNSSQCAPSP